MSEINTRKNFLVPRLQIYICENCGKKVAGGRYNNHCPFCLWSKHVDDVLPGDRQSQCQGLMEPISVFKKRGNWRILHRCQECGKEFVVDTNSKDNFELITKLSLMV